MLTFSGHFFISAHKHLMVIFMIIVSVINFLAINFCNCVDNTWFLKVDKIVKH